MVDRDDGNKVIREISPRSIKVNKKEGTSGDADSSFSDQNRES
jgi:hypothetical protein